MLDWEGMLASTIFLPGCNFRCPFCQNPDLVVRPSTLESVPFSYIEEFLIDRFGWIDGVCITGGEPCMHEDLAQLCEKIKSDGFGVKLDTNGSYPELLELLIEEEMLDFIAMDIKTQLDPGPYRVASGCDWPDLVELVDRSIDLIINSGLPHEFRTTVVPILHSPADIARIAERLQGDKVLVLQHFSPKETLDPRFSELKPFTSEDMKSMVREAKRFVQKCVVRNAPPGMDQ